MAGIGGGDPLPRVQAVDLRPLGSHLHRPAGNGFPRLIADFAQPDFAVPAQRRVDGLQHGLAGVLIPAGLTVIEHIPLAVDLHD